MIIIEQCVGVLSSSAQDQISTWTCELMDKTPQIAEEQLVMTIDKAQETKRFVVFCWRQQKRRNFKIDKALDYDFSATKMFFKNHHISLKDHNMIFPHVALP